MTRRQRVQAVRIAVLRHGITQPNAERRYVSASDVPLLPEAHRALAPARRRLAAMRPLVYSSDLRRCTETLARVCPSVQRRSGRARLDARLRELDFGRWEGMTYADLQSDAQYCAWLDDMTAVIPPDGEAWQRFADRTAAAWRDMLRAAALRRVAGPRRRNRGTRRMQPIAMLIVTHGGVLRRLHSLAWPSTSFWDVPAPTGGGYILVAQRQGTRWRMLRTELL